MTALDDVIQKFFERQLLEGLRLADESDVLDLLPLPAPGGQPLDYLARFRCQGLVCAPGGQVEEADRFDVSIRFHPQHLRRADQAQVRVVSPTTIFHPNALGETAGVLLPTHLLGLVCLNTIKPCTGLVEILFRVHSILTFENYATHEGYNPFAAEWARHPENRKKFPLDRRPLRRTHQPAVA